MRTPSIQDIEQIIRGKYARGEAWFRAGEMRNAVVDLYTEDLRYLSPNLKLIEGRSALIDYFESVRGFIAQVHVRPLWTWGDPQRVIYQFCNTERRAPDSDEVSRAHYIAAFRRVDGDWLIEMEVPASGHIVAPPFAS